MKKVSIVLVLLFGCSASNSELARKHIQTAQDCLRTAEAVCAMSGDPACVKSYISRADAACEIAKRVVDLVETPDSDGGSDAASDSR